MKKLITLFAFSAVAATAGAQFYQQCPKLTATGLAATAEFGSAVALSSDASTAIVGAWGGVNGAVGGAIIYNRTGSAWSQGPTLTGTGATGGANQGNAVAISADGNTAVIGGPSDNSGIGAAWVFTRSGGTWTQQGDKLVGTGATGNATQGYSVAISGDGNTIMIGGPNDNANVGAIWAFTRSGGTWSQQGAKIIGSSVAGGTAYQGISVALNGDGTTAILGGDGDDFAAGSVWIFTLVSGAWTQQGSKIHRGGYNNFGNAVAIASDGNTVLIGAAHADNNTGGAFVESRSSAGVWADQGDELLGLYPVGNAQQGSSVSLSADGNTAAVGGGSSTFAASAGDIGVGAVWLWGRSGSVWNPIGSKYVGTGNVGNCQQGESVAISGDGNTFITGGFADNTDAGAIWVFSQTIPTNFTYVSPLSTSLGATIYPVPATNQLTINFKTAINETTTITITDQLGRIVSATTVDGKETSYTQNTSALAPGAYILTAGAPNAGQQKFMFVKQ